MVGGSAEIVGAGGAEAVAVPRAGTKSLPLPYYKRDGQHAQESKNDPGGKDETFSHGLVCGGEDCTGVPIVIFEQDKLSFIMD